MDKGHKEQKREAARGAGVRRPGWGRDSTCDQCNQRGVRWCTGAGRARVHNKSGGPGRRGENWRARGAAGGRCWWVATQMSGAAARLRGSCLPRKQGAPPAAAAAAWRQPCAQRLTAWLAGWLAGWLRAGWLAAVGPGRVHLAKVQEVVGHCERR